MLDWKEYLVSLKSRVGQMGKLNHDVVRGYMAISQAKTANPKLDDKTRELVSLAAAISLRCDGCIVTHTAEAKKLGATEEEIAEVLGIAIAINAGAALGYSAPTLDAYANL